MSIEITTAPGPRFLQYGDAKGSHVGEEGDICWQIWDIGDTPGYDA